MEDQRLGRAMLVLRHRRGWRQIDLAVRAGVSQSAISDMERGRIERYTVQRIRRTLRALDASVALDPLWGGRGDLDRLLDADHARLMQRWADLHRRTGWDVWNEASYSIYGERGRIDLLAFHPPTGTLEVAECKTGIWDVQDTLGRLDAKIRLAPRIARERGWAVRRVVGALVFMNGTTVRRRVHEHAGLFARYSCRGREALAWVRDPRLAPDAGLLAFVSLPRTNQGGPRRAGQRRVRLATREPRADGTATRFARSFAGSHVQTERRRT
jgi:transcriptional regulator with XRE-family HTH domain